MADLPIQNFPVEATEYGDGDYLAMSSSERTAKIKAKNFAKKALAEGKNLPTTATEADLNNGNYIVVDTPEGPKKLPGDAIATKSVQGKLVSISGLYNIFGVTGKNIPLSTYSVGDVVDVTPVDDNPHASFSCGIAEINEGDYLVMDSEGGDSPRAWAFLDSSYKLLSVAPKYIQNKFRVVKAPANSAYVVVNHNNNNENGRTANAVIIQKSIDLKDSLSFQDSKTNPSANLIVDKGLYGYGYPTGSTSIGSTLSSTPTAVSTTGSVVFGCAEGDFVKVYAKGGSVYRVIAFVDSQNKMIARTDADSSASPSWWTMHAPKNTCRCVVNFDLRQESDVRHIRNNVAASSEAVLDKNVTLGTYAIGDIVDLTPSSVSGFAYAIYPCQYGDEFVVTAFGGVNPRAFAFLDKDDRLLAVAKSGLYMADEVIRAPLYSAKLIVQTNRDLALTAMTNVNKSAGASVVRCKDVRALNSLSSGGTRYVWNDLISIKNGKTFRDELQNQITSFEKPGDLMVHVSTHKIINDIIYVTYYANTRTDQEDPTKQTARFCYAPMNDLSSKTFVDLMDIGDSFDGKTVTAIYDTVFVTVDDDVLYLMWTARLGDDYARLYQTYTISTGEYSAIQYNYFKIGTDNVKFTFANLQTIFRKHNIPYREMRSDLGIMQKVTSTTENGQTYYYTGLFCFNLCFIARSTDLVTWEYVDQPSFENDAQWENACYVKGDWVYYSCRQTTANASAFLTRFNLLTRQWDRPVFIPDAQSRNDFFEYDGRLYLIYAPKNRWHLAVMRIDEQCLERSLIVQDAVLLHSCFYPFVTVHDGTIYITYTQERLKIALAAFTIGSISGSEDYNNQDIIYNLLSEA